MSAVPSLAPLRNLAGHTLKQFASLVSELVLDPNTSLNESDLASLKNTREVLVDLAYVGSGRQTSRGLSGSTEGTVVGGTDAFARHGAAEATELLKRVDHFIDLLHREHGPTECDRPHADLDHGSQRDG